MWRFGTLQVPHQVRAAALRGVNLRDVLVYMVSEVHALPKRGTFITLGKFGEISSDLHFAQ